MSLICTQFIDCMDSEVNVTIPLRALCVLHGEIEILDSMIELITYLKNNYEHDRLDDYLKEVSRDCDTLERIRQNIASTPEIWFGEEDDT
ncbi:MAG: hypothetical protein Q4C42_10885, partial [Clostridia bacterium]|nr:hypothetical protein [Clostridia bacterium]